MSSRKTALLVGFTVTMALIASMLALALIPSSGYTTSWGEKLRRSEHYLTIEGQTLTQKDLEHIAALKHLRFLELKDCNVGECRLPELKFASKELYRLSLEGTTGLWDLSFLSKLEVDDLNLSRCPDVTDISGLNWEVLGSLDVSETSVSDLSPVAGSQLRQITFAHTEVSDLSPLRETEWLWEANGPYTQVSSLDVLADLDNLYCMDFSGCPIKEVRKEFLSERLREVRLSDTPVETLVGLSTSTEMQVLDLGGCTRLTDLGWFSRRNHAELEELDLSRTGIAFEDLSWLASCTALERLALDGIALEDLSFCKNLHKLRYLSVLGCGLTDAAGIEGCSEMETLLLGYNRLESLKSLPRPVSEWPRLTVDLSYNNLESLAGLPSGEYHTLLLQGNDVGIGGTMPARVKAYNVVVPWYEGLEQGVLSDYMRFSHLYLLDCPAEEQQNLYRVLFEHRTNCLTEEELWERLLADDFDYTLYANFEGYVAYAREHADEG